MIRFKVLASALPRPLFSQDLLESLQCLLVTSQHPRYPWLPPSPASTAMVQKLIRELQLRMSSFNFSSLFPHSHPIPSIVPSSFPSSSPNLVPYLFSVHCCQNPGGLLPFSIDTSGWSSAPQALTCPCHVRLLFAYLLPSPVSSHTNSPGYENATDPHCSIASRERERESVTSMMLMNH